MTWLVFALRYAPKEIDYDVVFFLFGFLVQGAMVGVIGTLAGLVLGLGIALNIDVIVPAIEKALGATFLPKDIYLIDTMPSEPQSGDIVPIALISLALAFVATLYPSWRASRVNPAEALRYE